MEPPHSSKSLPPVTANFLTDQYASFQRESSCPDGSDAETWDVWRQELRNKLGKVFCLNAWGNASTPDVQILKEKNCGTYVRQKIAYETYPGNWAVAYLLLPNGLTSSTPAVLCPHGHFAGGKLAVVEPEHGAGMAYGHEFAKRGFVVLAPDNAGMGERDIAASDAIGGKTGCELLFRRLNYMGLDLTGLRIFDLMIGINILYSMRNVDESRLGCAGLSGGCWLAMVLSALDERVKAVILSGYFTTFMQTSWHGHCLCHHPHGIGNICEMTDIAALIAPRPLFVESGKQDHAYPVEPAYSLTRRAYGLLGAEADLGLDLYEGGHMFRGVDSIPWMVNELSI
jgi:dienelactone hydrolase